MINIGMTHSENMKFIIYKLISRESNQYKHKKLRKYRECCINKIDNRSK